MARVLALANAHSTARFCSNCVSNQYPVKRHSPPILLAQQPLPPCALSPGLQAWSPALVLDLLHRLVDASGIVPLLEKDGGQELFETNGQIPGSSSNVRLLLGYFSLLGLLRIYTLIGDYYMAL